MIESILEWERFDLKEGREDSIKSLTRKVVEGTWSPNPPIIISPIPSPYQGKYTHFVYNGNTRLMVAKTHILSLNTVVVPFNEEVQQGGTFWSPLYTLKYVLSNYLGDEKEIDHLWSNKNDLQKLLEGFQARFG